MSQTLSPRATRTLVALAAACVCLPVTAQTPTYFTVTETVPAGCLSATNYGAIPNDQIDDTAAIRNLLAAAAATSGRCAYLPAGIYRVSESIDPPAGVRITGSRSGMTVLENTSPSYLLIGNATWGVYRGYITLENLFLNHIGVMWAGGEYKESNQVRTSVLFSARSGAGTAIEFQYGAGSAITDSLILRSPANYSPGISLFKTDGVDILRNVIGLDLEQTSWLAREWSGASAWQQLPDKLAFLKAHYRLDADQGHLIAGIYPGREVRSNIQRNFFNGTPNYAGTPIRDHVVYHKGFAAGSTFAFNYLRGWPHDASGGLKVRNGKGLEIVGNFFDDTPLITYTHNEAGLLIGLQDILVYRNYFIARSNLSFNRPGISYYEPENVGDDRNLFYAENRFDNADQLLGIHLTNTNVGGANSTAFHYAYTSNTYVHSGNPVRYVDNNGPLTLLPGAPDPALTARWAAAQPVFHFVPPFVRTAGTTDIVASGETTSIGKVVLGTFAATTASDNTVEALSEISDGTTSALSHVWRFTVPNAGALTLHIEAWKTLSSDGDNFKLQYSPDGITWTDAGLTITKTADDHTLQSVALPASLRGTVHIRAVDTDRSAGRKGIDTLYVDRLFLRSAPYAETFSFDDPATDTLAELRARGWQFTGGTETLGTRTGHQGQFTRYLQLGGQTSVLPTATYPFPTALAKGSVETRFFTGSTAPQATVSVLDAANNVLAAFQIATPTQFAVTAGSGGQASRTIPNGGTHDLLSSGAGFSHLAMQWQDGMLLWYVTNQRASDGTVVYRQAGASKFLGSGTPAKIRFGTGVRSSTSQVIGLAGVRVTSFN